MILLDTNVVSETLRPQPDANVIAWIDAQPAETLYLCAPVLAELHQGAALLPEGRRRAMIAAAIEGFEADLFRNRVLVFESSGAREFGRMIAQRRRIGRPTGLMDAMIAAIAAANNATLATRDLTGFADLGIDLINPFAPRAA